MTITVDNRTEDFPALLKQQGHWIAPNGACFCPFHEDEGHRSGKVFQDTDGWRLWCWVCQQQFRPADYYRKLKRDGVIDEEVVVIGGTDEDDDYEPLDVSFLDGFRAGAMDMKAVCRAIFENKRERKDLTEGTGQNEPETG